jgi:hypothetical protein
MNKLRINLLIVILLLFSVNAFAYTTYNLQLNYLNATSENTCSNPTLAYDGLWNTHSHGFGSLSQNYSYNGYITQASVTYETDIIPQTVTVNLNASCITQNPIAIRIDTGVQNDVLYCHNATGWLEVKKKSSATYNADIYEVNLTLTLVNQTNICEGPSYPIYAYSGFNYPNPISVCSWQTLPPISVSPTDGALCYDPEGVRDFQFPLFAQGNKYSFAQFTEEFDLKLVDGSVFEHTFYSQPPNSNPAGGNIIYTLEFFNIDNDTYIGYIYDNQYNSVCTNCYDLDSDNHIKITIYKDAKGYTAYNESSLKFEPINDNTISLEVNDNIVGFNMPFLNQNTTQYVLPTWSTFTISGGLFCLDNYILYQGFSSDLVLNVTIENPYRQLNEPCTYDWECFTGKCVNSYCQGRDTGESCLNDYECTSYSCLEGGVCDKPTLWRNIDNLKNEFAGDDNNTNNLLAITFSVILGIVIAFMAMKLGSAILAGIGGLFGLMVGFIFFTIVGWMSPFIVIGLIIIAVMGTAIMIILGSRG